MGTPTIKEPEQWEAFESPLEPFQVLRALIGNPSYILSIFRPQPGSYLSNARVRRTSSHLAPVPQCSSSKAPYEHYSFVVFLYWLFRSTSAVPQPHTGQSIQVSSAFGNARVPGERVEKPLIVGLGMLGVSMQHGLPH